MKNNKIDSIKNNPLFVMSLHSKELFHSNFWAWLFERNHEYVKIFFPKLSDHDCVEREQGNRDITIWFDEKAYVIENKFKSLPDYSQIKRYEKELKQSFSKGVITGIIKPDFINKEKDWIFMSYETISDKILEVAQKIEKNCFEKELIYRYAEMLKDLNLIITDFLGSTKKMWVSSFDFSDLETIRMDDVIQKYSASVFSKYINERLKNSDVKKAVSNYDLIVTNAYSNKHAAVDVRYVQQEKSDSISVIGIQIEGNQYRWFVQMNNSLNNREKEKLFDQYVSLGWFADYNEEKKVIKGHNTKLSKRFNKYETKDYVFLYQYWNIENAEYDVLLKQIIQDIRAAADILQRKNHKS